MKKYILIIVLLVSFTGCAFAEQIRVWHKGGQSVRTTICPQSVDYNVCIVDAMSANPDLSTYESVDLQREDLPTDNSQGIRGTWEYDSNSKKVKVNQVKKQAMIDEKNRKKNARKKTATKLKDLGLTAQEIKDALGIDENETN